MVNPFIALGTLVNAKTNIQNRFVFNGISQIRVIESLREDVQNKNSKRVNKRKTLRSRDKIRLMTIDNH